MSDQRLDMPDARPTVSIVVPAFNEAGNVAVLYRRIADVLASSWQWELILIDDGSADDTFERIQDLARQDPRVIGLSLARNFGHQYALLAGLDVARGEAIISMDADLQHPPELLPELLRHWQDGANVVMTERLPAGQLPWWKVWTSNQFYRLFSALTGVRMEAGDSDFRLLDAEVLDRLRQVDRTHLFMRGLVRWAGYHAARVPYSVAQRHSGRSSYSLGRMMRLGVTGITAFSSAPLRAGIGLGVFTAALAAMEFAYALWTKMTGKPVQGWVSLVGLITALFSMNFLLIGMIGVYIGRVFEKVQGRPPYLVEQSTDDAMRLTTRAAARARRQRALPEPPPA